MRGVWLDGMLEGLSGNGFEGQAEGHGHSGGALSRVGSRCYYSSLNPHQNRTSTGPVATAPLLSPPSVGNIDSYQDVLSSAICNLVYICICIEIDNMEVNQIQCYLGQILCVCY